MHKVLKVKETCKNDILIEFYTKEELHPKDIVSVITKNKLIKLFTVLEVIAENETYLNVVAKMIKQENEIIDLRKIINQEVDIEMKNDEFEDDESDDYKRGFRDGSNYALSTF